MPVALEQITKDAMDLPPRQKLALAEFLLESAEAAADPGVISLSLGGEGSLRLPPEWLDAQGLAAGDPVICRTDPRGLLIMSRAAATEALRELARKHMPGEAALLDALLSGTREQL